MKFYHSFLSVFVSLLWTIWLASTLYTGLMTGETSIARWGWLDMVSFSFFFLPGAFSVTWLAGEIVSPSGQFTVTFRHHPPTVRVVAPRQFEVTHAAGPGLTGYILCAGMSLLLLIPMVTVDNPRPALILVERWPILAGWLGVGIFMMLWIKNWRRRLLFDLQANTVTVLTYEFGYLSRERTHRLHLPLRATAYYSRGRGRSTYETRWYMSRRRWLAVRHANGREALDFRLQAQAAGMQCGA